MQETTKGTSKPGNEAASGLQKNVALKPWEIAVKLLPLENGLVDIEHASDAQFQAWIDNTGLSDLVDDEGIAEWSFDDRVRVINFAIKQGRSLQFAGENNSDNSENNSDSELFEGDNPASEAV
jgi:hypothetical protein